MSISCLKNSNSHFKSRKAQYLQDTESTLKPKKHLGQVFLKNKTFLNKIIKAGDISAKDLVIEIGPGTGILTEALLQTGAKVIAIEKDPQLVQFLKNRFHNNSNLTIIEGDIRDLLNSNFQFLISKQIPDSKFQILNSNYKVVGNIPYYLTSHLIQLLLELKHQPQVIVLMIQKEVAQRIIAQPPQMNLLAVSIQFFAQPEIISSVPKGAFWPQPKVDSAIIKLTLINTDKNTDYTDENTDNTDKKSFFRVVKAGFSHPRKLLISNLSQNLKIPKNQLENVFQKLNFDLNTRAQNLSLNDWKNLATYLFA